MMRKSGKNVKKMTAAGLCVIMLLGMTACGSASMNDVAFDSAKSESSTAWNGSSSNYDSADGMDYDFLEKEEYGYESDGWMEETPVTDTAGGESSQNSVTSRKVIKTASLNLQTLEFDEFAAALEAKIAEAGAYLQYADVSGSNYYGGRKSANYTIRVPEANLNAFLAGIDGIATVTSKTLGEEDVTLTYVDTEARIKALQTEQERLLALLEKAENLDSIILLEERLSEVRYSIESYQSKLRTYDDKITYSTVYIYVYEVTRVTEKEPETLWERISSGWSETMYNISDGAEDFLVWVVVNLPYLLFWGAVLVVLLVVCKKRKAKRQEKKRRNQKEKNETILDSQE